MTLKKNDYNISPSCYIHTSDAETYRPIAEIVEELKVIEAEAKETDVEATGDRGLIAKAGRYGGTFAHRDIASEGGGNIKFDVERIWNSV